MDTQLYRFYIAYQVKKCKCYAGISVPVEYEIANRIECSKECIKWCFWGFCYHAYWACSFERVVRDFVPL